MRGAGDGEHVVEAHHARRRRRSSASRPRSVAGAGACRRPAPSLGQEQPVGDPEQQQRRRRAAGPGCGAARRRSPSSGCARRSAPTAPQTIARFCSAAGRLRAASAMTIALSPASTRSMTTIASKRGEEGGGIHRRSRSRSVRACADSAKRRRRERFANRDRSRIAIDRLAPYDRAATQGFARCQNAASRASSGSRVQSGSSSRPGSPGRPMSSSIRAARPRRLGCLSARARPLPFSRPGTAMTTRSAHRRSAPLFAPRHSCPSLPRSRPSSASAARRARRRRCASPSRPSRATCSKLGDALGVRLFELRGKRLVPTAAALALLQATHEVSAALARCEQTLGAYRDDGSRGLGRQGSERAGWKSWTRPIPRRASGHVSLTGAHRR